MGHLHIADVKIVIGKNRAADRAYQDGAVLQAEILDDLGEIAVHDPVAATGAVVRRACRCAGPVERGVHADCAFGAHTRLRAACTTVSSENGLSIKRDAAELGINSM